MRNNFPKIIPTIFLFLIFVQSKSFSQDKINLVNGKIITASKIELRDNTIAYYTLGERSKLKTINPERVFSVKYADSAEFVVYRPDAYDSTDFNIEQMRLFIKGEQDASLYYRNTSNKIIAGIVGAGFSYFTFYGLIGPPLYTTVIGGFSPNMDKQKVSDEKLRDIPEYREGYSRKVRDKKIRNSIVSGFAGFVAGFITLTIVEQNKK